MFSTDQSAYICQHRSTFNNTYIFIFMIINPNGYVSGSVSWEFYPDCSVFMIEYVIGFHIHHICGFLIDSECDFGRVTVIETTVRVICYRNVSISFSGQSGNVNPCDSIMDICYIDLFSNTYCNETRESLVYCYINH